MSLWDHPPRSHPPRLTTVQDSFSPAHTVRRTESPSYGVLPSDARGGAEDGSVETCRGACGCILRVKAYLRRDEEFRAGILKPGRCQAVSLARLPAQINV